ncbi:hypothetical protein ACOME3_005273 [Neoechinorhynchus agilis]
MFGDHCFVKKTISAAFCQLGRMGNQVEQFLGTMDFSRRINRTLVLPNWPGTYHCPFETFFKTETIKQYVDAVSTTEFMQDIAPQIWPNNERTVFCYDSRSRDRRTCAAKDGEPFKSYWNSINVDFVRDEFYKPLSYHQSDKWKIKYSNEKYPVIAFVGAPAPFPIAQQNIHLQRYLDWSKSIREEGEEFIGNINQPYIGLHLRNGSDFIRACEMLKKFNMKQLFSSAQCFGYDNDKTLNQSVCSPPFEILIEKVQQVLKKTGIKSLFIASDSDYDSESFREFLPQVTIYKYPRDYPQMDLYILSSPKCSQAILNCFSSFSAFVKRQRDINGDNRYHVFVLHASTIMITVVISLTFLRFAITDVYLQSPIGLNSIPSKDKTATLFNSQNNECSKNSERLKIPLKFYTSDHKSADSVVTLKIDPNKSGVHWTLANASILVQYRCRDKAEEFKAETDQYGMSCKIRGRTLGLYTADRKLGVNPLGYSSAMFTRQNPLGFTFGNECTEERDYYPYWRSSPWIDAIYLTTDHDDYCNIVVAHSNQKKFECLIESDLLL